MKRVDIDFAAPSLRRTLFRTRPAAWLLGLVALLLCLAVAAVGAQLLGQRRADAVQLDGARQLASATIAAPVQLPRPAVPEAQALAVNRAILQLNLPWRQLQDAIASATPPGIALLALEPDAHQRSMRITAEAKNSDDMIGYVELLKREELFSSVTLTRHDISEQDPNRPIRFQLDAAWSAP